MNRRWWRRTNLLAISTLAASVLGACATARHSRSEPAQQTASSGANRPPAWIAQMDSGRPRFTSEDVSFMQGMIHHHAQAVLMAGWAPTHGAGSAVRGLCERIVVAQRDEIAFMQRWLRERQLDVPDADASHDMMPGMQRMMMPGMLNADQLAQLDHTAGRDFDKLFLQFMIVHHQGALAMVAKLFASPGATQDDIVFKFAADVNADQGAEIDRMTRLLSTY